MANSTRPEAHLSSNHLIQKLIPPHQSILVTGAENAHLMEALLPSRCLVLESDSEQIAIAKDRHPGIHFQCGDFSSTPPEQSFDWLIIPDGIIHWKDIRRTLLDLRNWMSPTSKALFTLPNPALQWLRSHRSPTQNWVGKHDLRNLLSLADFHVEAEGSSKLSPYLVATLAPLVTTTSSLSCSVIVPTRNEVGNIPDCLSRIPEMGSGTEILFVDGSSDDGTVEAIEAGIREYPDKTIRLIHQLESTEEFNPHTQKELERVRKIGKMLPQGKADAVRKGFRAATGDVLMILDADLTVAPEDLPVFFEQIAAGRGDFINGVRLLYPQEQEAMKLVNLLGNTFFGFALSWLMGQRIKDSLCGTKVFRRADYDRIMKIEETLGNFDPFGDFELLFGAAQAGLKIVDLPIHYGRRVSGQPKIETYRHGLKLFRMLWYGFLLFKVKR